MPYILLEKGHTVSAADFDNNFKHVGQGHLLPHGGTLLEETTGVYDLGSNDYRWNNVHVQNLEIQSGGEVQRCMNLIAETTLTATASSIEFTGFNGETDEIYEIIYNVKGYATGVAYLYFNGDSATNNYGWQTMYANNTTILATRSTSSTGFFIGGYKYGTITANYIKGNMILYANNSIKLALYKDLDRTGDTFVNYILKWGKVWNNSATLTSMKFTGYFDPGTNIQIWSKR